MDGKTEKILHEADVAVKVAEAIDDAASEKEAATVVSTLYMINKQIGKLEERRKFKNKAAQDTVRTHTTWFAPMIKRLNARRDLLRNKLIEWMAPGGNIGNQDVEEIKVYGDANLGTAALAETTTYEINLPMLVKNHPELVQADMSKIAAAYRAGDKPKGTKPIKSYQLRIT